MKILLSVSFILLCSSVFAKKVKFSVDMRNQTVNATGVHIVGDFQEAAGLGTNFGVMSPMTQEGVSTVYSLVVDIPAFQKYEYKFANGDLFYEVEFVPVESRVGYDFVDNRWLYVDSLANDTTFAGAILYAENAPYGFNMARLLIDLTDEPSINADGIHVAGNFNSWNSDEIQIISLQNNAVYEGIVYVESGTYEYKFYNGQNSGSTETVPGACAINGNRSMDISAHTVFTQVCFSSCTACLGAGVSESIVSSALVYPQPFTDFATVTFNGSLTSSAVLVDLAGNILQSFSLVDTNQLIVSRNNLKPGIYFLQMMGAAEFSSIKLILE